MTARTRRNKVESWDQPLEGTRKLVQRDESEGNANRVGTSRNCRQCPNAGGEKEGQYIKPREHHRDQRKKDQPRLFAVCGPAKTAEHARNGIGQESVKDIGPEECDPSALQAKRFNANPSESDRYDRPSQLAKEEPALSAFRHNDEAHRPGNHL